MRILSVMPVNYKCCTNKNSSVNYKNNVPLMHYVPKVNFGNAVSELPKNFGTVIENKLFRGGLLETAEHFQVLKDKGVTLILDLCGNEEKRLPNPEEAKMAVQFGMKYLYHDGFKFFCGKMLNQGANPKKELEKVAQIVKKELAKPKGVVYVHCRQGKDRTGLFVGYYQLKVLRISIAKAKKEHEKYEGYFGDFDHLLKVVSSHF